MYKATIFCNRHDLDVILYVLLVGSEFILLGIAVNSYVIVNNSWYTRYSMILEDAKSYDIVCDSFISRIHKARNIF